MITRRGFLSACIATFTAPAIVRAASLMPLSVPKLLDDTAALIALIAAAQGSLLLPPRAWRITKPLSLPYNFSLYGQGAMLYYDGPKTEHVVQLNGSSYVTQLNVDGNHKADYMFCAPVGSCGNTVIEAIGDNISGMMTVGEGNPQRPAFNISNIRMTDR